MNNRYSRQIHFKPIGEKGQKLLATSIVTIIGCGALGSVSSESLARAGVGEIHLADRDYVELSNLHRQQLFTEHDVELSIPKVIAAKQRLLSIRSDLKLETYLQHVDADLMENLAQKSDLIIDATDNFETRLLINDAAFKYKVPWIYGACIGSSGVIFPFVPNQTPCLRCLLPTLPSLNETCETAGVISPAVQMTAAMQTAEALKWLTGNVREMSSKVHHFDTWRNEHLHIGIKNIKKTNCKSCGKHPTYPSLSTFRREKISMLCGRDTIQILPNQQRVITLNDAEKVAKKIKATMRRTPYFVEFWVRCYRIMVFDDGRLFIHGLSDLNIGRKIYVELFG